jgi:ribosomal protein S10
MMLSTCIKMTKKRNITIYLMLKSFFFTYLKRDLKKLVLYLKKNRVYGDLKKINLPVSIKKISVVRSPFVSKLSKEQYEIRTYRVLCILKPKGIHFYKPLLQELPRFSYFKLCYKCQLN